MIGIPFYNESIKQAVAVFGSLFNNIVIRRKDGKLVPVAISYGPRDKWREAQYELEQDQEMFEKMLPRMSYEVVAMNYDMQRKITNKQQIKGVHGTDKPIVQRVGAPVPYMLDFSLYIQTKNLNDGWQIVEQILPFFTPAYTVQVRHFPLDLDSDTPDMENTYDMPFVLNAVTWTDDWTGDLGDRRMIEWQLEFNTKIWLSGPPQTSTTVFYDPNGTGLASNKCYGRNIILDSRAIVTPVPTNSDINTLTRKDIVIGDEVGYAVLDSDAPVYQNDSDLSPDIINTTDSDGRIIRIIRNIENY